MKKPKISIITICHNEPKLERTCESVAQQTFNDYEWIVIDSGSDQSTQDIFEKYKRHMSYFLSEKDKGIYDAMNKGIRIATGEWLIFLDAGDKFIGLDTLAKIAPELDGENFDIVYGYADQNGGDKRPFKGILSEWLDWNFWMMGALQRQSQFIKRELFEWHGGYRTDYKVLSDNIKNTDFFRHGVRFKYVDMPVAFLGDSGLTGDFKLYNKERDRFKREYFPEYHWGHMWLAYTWFRILKTILFRGHLHDRYKHRYRAIKDVRRKDKMYRAKPMPRLLFIARSYHEKTRSCDFMVDYLREFFSVDVTYDESWHTGLSDTGPITDKYDAVVFWSNLPDSDIFKRIKHKNIVWFPMADGTVNWSPNEYRRVKKIKLVNFCKLINRRCQYLRMNSMYIQYFTKPAEFAPGDLNRTFFWQRRAPEVGISDVTAVLANVRDVQIQMHTAVDAENEVQMPTKEQEERFGMTYSNWFESKHDLLNIIKENGIYIAPRMYEGTGLGFLEAMAMGKVVIAWDRPTMNEYIHHNVTGYLVDFHNPVQLDLINAPLIQKNAYRAMVAGYERWVARRYEIVKFINSKRKKLGPLGFIKKYVRTCPKRWKKRLEK